ncbi:Ig-like domain-containing protein, partial [Rahnella bruchi]
NAGSASGDFKSGTTTDDSTPTLTGHAAADSVVKIYEGSTLLGSTTADKDGDWNFTPSARSEGKHTFTATATDAAGNASGHSGNFVINIDIPDTTAPDAPVITEVYDDVGLYQGPVASGGKTDDTTPTLHGTAEAGSTVVVRHVTKSNGNTYVDGSVVADADGNWTLQVNGSLPNTRTYTATATDAAGNKSAASHSYVVNFVDTNHDTTAPDAPVINTYHDNVGTSTGDFNSGTITDDITPTLKGHAEVHSVVKVYEGSTLLGSTTAGNNGDWSFTPSARSEGKHTFFATATDAAGNVSGHSGHFVVNVDTGLPHVSGIEYFGDASNEHGYSFTTSNGVKVDAGYGLEIHKLPGMVHDGLGSHTDVINNGSDIRITLPGVADKVTVCGQDGFSFALPDVTFYDAAGKEVSVSRYGESGGGLINWTSTVFTANGGQTIASCVVHNALYLSSIKWESTATSTYKEPMLHQAADQDNAPAGQDIILTPAQVDNTHKSTGAMDITDHVQNTLHLTLNDILSEAHANLFIQDDHKQLAITGDQGDVVELKVEDLAHNTWQDAGQVTSGGIQYEVYQHTG